MLVVGVERVNLTEPEESTIGAAAGLGAWLRARSTRLPWLVRAGFVCLPPRCVFCGGQGDLGAVDLCSVCLETLPFDAATGRGGSAGAGSGGVRHQTSPSSRGDKRHSSPNRSLA